VVQAKIKGIQKRKYIPGGLKTRKDGPGKSLGFSKNNTKKEKEKTKTEASQFKWVK